MATSIRQKQDIVSINRRTGVLDLRIVIAHGRFQLSASFVTKLEPHLAFQLSSLCSSLLVGMVSLLTTLL
jgi:hypothetical protein